MARGASQDGSDGYNGTERLLISDSYNSSMARIVRTHNFGYSGESPGYDEVFILHPMSDDCAKRICEALNDEGGPRDSWYYRVTENDYKLAVFKP